MKTISVEFNGKNYTWLAHHLESELEEEERMVEHYAKFPDQKTDKKRHEDKVVSIKKTLGDLYGVES